MAACAGRNPGQGDPGSDVRGMDPPGQGMGLCPRGRERSWYHTDPVDPDHQSAGARPARPSGAGTKGGGLTMGLLIQVGRIVLAIVAGFIAGWLLVFVAGLRFLPPGLMVPAC